MTTRPPAAPGAAAAAAVAPLLRGPAVTGTVIAALSAAVVVGLDTAAGPRVITLLAPGASATPHGVRLPNGSDLFGTGRPDAGEPVVLGSGRIGLRGRSRPITRTWPTAVPIVGPADGALAVLADTVGDAVIGVSRDRVRDLAEAMSGAIGAAGPVGGPDPEAAVPAAVRALVGAGAGLTPAGDDVLAGLLVGLRAAGRDRDRRRVAAVLGTDLHDRTTALSADLLRLAAAGHALTAVLTLLRTLHDPMPRPAGIRGAAAGVLAVGHTSGADLLTGLLLGLGSAPVLPRSVPVPAAGLRKDPS